MNIFSFFPKGFIPGVIFMLLAFNSAAQHNITVNVANVLSDVSQRPVGINVNYLMDGSYITPAPAISTTAALQNMGVKFMRYPGGEKSDNYIWSSPPWTGASPKFARTGSCEWPSNDSRFALSDRTTAKANVLDFDEFMSMCQAAGGEPLIVVAYDCMYKAASCGTVPTKEQLLTAAEEWVRYANIVKGYNVKYWMIGNESYHSGSYNGQATATQYRSDVIEFSQRMKAIDPTIKIIANGDGNSWWSTVLPTAAYHIDYLGVSNYPVWNYTGGYSYYQNGTPNLMGAVNNAVNAINSYAPASERSRLKVISTELNSMDWAGTWPDANDVGHALVTFEMIGEHLKNPKVAGALLWNTRWVNNTTSPNHIYDAISASGTLNANGRVLSIWGRELLNKMVSATATTAVRAFASYNLMNNDLNVYLINKQTTSQQVNLALSNYVANASADRWVYKGTGPSDVNPIWTQDTDVTAGGNQLALSLPGASITLLRFRPGKVVGLPVTFSMTDRLDQVILNWKTQTGNRMFIVERSANGIDFTAIASIEGVGKDNSYSYTDKSPLEGVSYYRLKQVDNDGTASYSEALSVSRIKPKAEWKVYPNPARDEVNISFGTDRPAEADLQVITIDGKLYMDKKLPVEDGKLLIDVQMWPKGMYFLKIVAGEMKLTQKLVVD